MTPLPKRKLSTRRQGKRRKVKLLGLAAFELCSNCHKPRLSHKACPWCHQYAGKSVKKA